MRPDPVDKILEEASKIIAAAPSPFSQNNWFKVVPKLICNIPYYCYSLAFFENSVHNQRVKCSKVIIYCIHI